MDMMDSIKTCFNKYIDFSGRASRSEYWWFVLFCFVVEFVARMINVNLYFIAVLAVLLPFLAVLVRRLHDTDHTGWWILLLLVPVVGPLVLLYFAIIKGTAGPNRYGIPPVI